MADVKIKKIKPFKMAYIEHVGSYDEIPFDEYISQLYGWTKEKKVRPGFRTIGIFYDSPEKTSPEKCRSEIGIPITGEVEGGEKIKIKEIPSMDVAVIKHKGPASQYSETYRKITEWIEENGYEWAGPAMEIYTKKPKIVGDERILYATIQVPIKKK